MPKKDRSSFSQFKDLNRKRKIAKQSDDFAKLAEVYNELGDEYRRIGDLNKALKKQNKCVINAELANLLEYQVYAHRAIAEMHVENADYDLARKHADEHVRTAELYRKAHLVQLAYHVKGWVLLQTWTAIVENKSNESTDPEQLLMEAKRSLEQSMSYLNAHSAEINADKEARNGGDVNRRRAGIQQVLSEVYDKLNHHTDAITFHLAALKYAERYEDLDLQYRCLFSKLGFSEEDKLRTAQHMVAVAEKMTKSGDKTKKYEALLQLAEAKMNVEDFLGAKDAFETVFLEGKAFVPKDDWKHSRTSLISLYKIVRRVDAWHDLPGDDHRSRMRLADKIADDLCEINAFEAAVAFYMRVLDAATALRSQKDIMAAVMSVASAAFDASQFALALDYYEQLLALESSAGVSNKKLLNTRECIAKCAVEVCTLSVDQVLLHCHEALVACANANAVTSEIATLNCLIAFLKRRAPNHPKLSESEDRLTLLEEKSTGTTISDDDEDEESDPVNSYSDELDLLTPERILQLCKDEFKLKSEDDKIKQEKDKVINSHGETRLHDAARGDDTNYLRKLIKAGYNVNAKDYGKWTPLMEAVNANRMDNVRLLLQANANVNAQSKQGIVDEDKDCESASGLTPLMGAAEMLFLPIIRLLIAHPHINLTIKNSEGWTALDMLEDALRRRATDTGIDPDDRTEANRLIAELRRRMVAVGVTPAPPPPRNADRPTGRKAVLSSLQRRHRAAPTVAKEYEDIMVGLGRGQVHRRGGMTSPEPTADTAEDARVAADEMDDFIVADDDEPDIVPIFDVPVTSSPRPTSKRRLPAPEERLPRKRHGRVRSVLAASDENTFEPLPSQLFDEQHPTALPSSSVEFQSSFETFPSSSTTATLLHIRRSHSPKPKVIKLTFENANGASVRDPICHSVSGQTVGDVKRAAEKLLAQATGQQAIVKLTMSDGTELVDDAFAVDSAFGCDPAANSLNVLRIVVIEWFVQTVVERYEQFALNDKIGIYSNWKTALMSVGASGLLNLSNGGVTGRKALPLLRALQQDCGLLELDLSGNRLQATETKHLAGVILSQPSLQRLSLAGCSLIREALDAFLKHVDLNASLPLKRLDLNGNAFGEDSAPFVAALIRRCPGLEQLDLSATRMTAEFARQLRHVLQGLGQLKIVKFARNPLLGATGISILLQSCQQLVDADFSNSAKSTDEDLTNAILTYANLPGARPLQRLNLEGCYLPSKVAERLGSAVNMLQNLSHLNISSTSVDATGLSTLIDVFKHNTVIAELVLLNCPISSKDLSSIALKLRELADGVPLRVRLSTPANNILVKLLAPFCATRVLLDM